MVFTHSKISLPLRGGVGCRQLDESKTFLFEQYKIHYNALILSYKVCTPVIKGDHVFICSVKFILLRTYMSGLINAVNGSDLFVL